MVHSRMNLEGSNRDVTCVSLEFADVKEKGNKCSHGRMERQKEQGSESVDDEPWPHTCRNTKKPRMLRCFAKRALAERETVRRRDFKVADAAVVIGEKGGGFGRDDGGFTVGASECINRGEGLPHRHNQNFECVFARTCENRRGNISAEFAQSGQDRAGEVLQVRSRLSLRCARRPQPDDHVKQTPPTWLAAPHCRPPQSTGEPSTASRRHFSRTDLCGRSLRRRPHRKS